MEGEPIYFTNPPYFYRLSATDQISVLFRRGPSIMYAVKKKIGENINAGFMHIRQSCDVTTCADAMKIKFKGTRDNFKIHVNFMKSTFLCSLRQDETYDKK